MAGHFITFEGGEGAGKSTQIARLKTWLEAQGKTVIVTREPGGSPGAEKIRQLLLSGEAKDLGPRGEAMLFATARADHVDTTIIPALKRGDWVLCDRYADSTRVYQGEAGVDIAYLKLLETAAVAGTYPDLTILIDVPAEIGLSRVEVRSQTDNSGGPDRFEGETMKVHKRRRQMFLDLAEEEAHRFAVIDGSKDLDQVETAIRSAVATAFASELKPDGETASITEASR
ncbi:dTMP kinase [Labrenzia sp. VG12]|uniref:dTMP kinase n=1 Tax=Labrenzia sp. VG12 TaxID=2021862 RepID=UPI000B8C0F80|nr:dTMP kinase [Labrenzia sp. VG12]ASP32847.1 dTMP kinase [Labrenzia sp. VG12]